jgi:hypothetical protein
MDQKTVDLTMIKVSISVMCMTISLIVLKSINALVKGPSVKYLKLGIINAKSLWL